MHALTLTDYLCSAVLIGIAVDLVFGFRFLTRWTRIEETLGNYVVEFERKVRRFEREKAELQLLLVTALESMDEADERDTLRQFPSAPPVTFREPAFSLADIDRIVAELERHQQDPRATLPGISPESFDLNGPTDR